MTATTVSELIENYLGLGGVMKSAADDILMSTRLWADEPDEVAAFWEENVASLPAGRRKEVDSLLPWISGDTP